MPEDHTLSTAPTQESVSWWRRTSRFELWGRTSWAHWLGLVLVQAAFLTGGMLLARALLSLHDRSYVLIVVFVVTYSVLFGFRNRPRRP